MESAATAEELFKKGRDLGSDTEYGGWYHLLDRANERYSHVKSPPPKTDYHPVAACYQSIIAFET